MYDYMIERLRKDAPSALANCDFDFVEGWIKEAADAMENLLSEIEKYRHAAFIIGETCVEADKMHITPEAALQKIRENIYYTRHE